MNHLGHKSRAIHAAYVGGARVTVLPLEYYEAQKEKKLIQFSAAPRETEKDESRVACLAGGVGLAKNEPTNAKGSFFPAWGHAGSGFRIWRDRLIEAAEEMRLHERGGQSRHDPVIVPSE